MCARILHTHTHTHNTDARWCFDGGGSRRWRLKDLVGWAKRDILVVSCKKLWIGIDG